jgi:hypothetical protein
MLWVYVLIALVGANPLVAQNNAPISAIDWLSQPTLAPLTEKNVITPQTNTDKVVNEITTIELDLNRDEIYGLIPQEISGIPEDFWTEIDSDTLRQVLMSQPSSNLPSADDLLIRALLAKTRGNIDVMLVRVETLIDRGAVQAAFSLVKQSKIENIQSFALFAKTALLTNNVEKICIKLNGARHLSNNEALQVYCHLHSGSQKIAEINYVTLKALGAFRPTTSRLLAAHLNKKNNNDFVLPEVNLVEITPLDFQMWAGVGQPISTTSLPVSFATYDLRETSSWLQKIQAAERLSIIGSLPGSTLLQTYTSDQVSTSGGIWDRVLAVQALHRALSDPAIDPTNELNTFWGTLQDKRLIAALARAWSARLLEFDTKARNNDFLFQMQILSRPNAFPFEITMERLQTKNKLLPTKVFKEIMNSFKKEILVTKKFGAINTLRAMRLVSKALNGERPALLEAIILYQEMGLTPLAQQLALEYMIIGQSQ